MEYLTFKNGRQIPVLGVGLFLATDPVELEHAINVAVRSGYRHFDTAYLYQNEHVLGKVLADWISSGRVTRQELFITTKLPLHGNHPDRVAHFLRLSLTSLRLDYVDLYLIHNPVGLKYVSDEEFCPTDKSGDGDALLDTSTSLEALWAAMETQVERGHALSIGVSNFNEAQLERVVKVAKVHPACNQVEVHVYFQQKQLREACARFGVQIVAYAPLGSPGRSGRQFKAPAVFNDPVVVEYAGKYGKTPAQVCLRFLIQLGLSNIPKSTNEVRLKENLNVFDFQISAQDMRQLQGLDKGEGGRSFKMNVFKGLAGQTSRISIPCARPSCMRIWPADPILCVAIQSFVINTIANSESSEPRPRFFIWTGG